MNKINAILIGASIALSANYAQAQLQSHGTINTQAQQNDSLILRMRATNNTTIPVGKFNLSYSALYDASTQAIDNGFGTSFLSVSSGAGGIGAGAFKPNAKRHVKTGVVLETKLALPLTEAKINALIPFNKEPGNLFANTKTTVGKYEARAFGNYDVSKGFVATEAELSMRTPIHNTRIGVQANGWGSNSKNSYSINVLYPFKLR